MLIILFLFSQALSQQITLERDAAEREAREKETRVLSLTRELDDFMEKIEELERSKRQLQAELDELVNNQGTTDKSVSTKFYKLSAQISVVQRLKSDINMANV